ncbi:hypothetical protein Bbelb_295860, partial [Branchiostoma belcheri]
MSDEEDESLESDDLCSSTDCHERSRPGATSSRYLLRDGESPRQLVTITMTESVRHDYTYS